MNNFDHILMTYINQYSQNSPVFDNTVAFIASHNFLKSGILIALLWWAWFKQDKQQQARLTIVITIVCCFAAMLLAKMLEFTTPFRARPIHETALHFLIPFGQYPAALDNFSSFPSDHAALFFALAVGLFFVSKKIGVFAIAYTILIISLPRVYLGLHYPTDIIAGAMIGILAALMGNLYLTRNKIVNSIVNFSNTKPAIFYPLFFLLSYQIVDLFGDARAIASPLKHFLISLAA
jgi:undecaprenyl-diphosphatase